VVEKFSVRSTGKWDVELNNNLKGSSMEVIDIDLRNSTGKRQSTISVDREDDNYLSQEAVVQ
jgi:hypothetical protein